LKIFSLFQGTDEKLRLELEEKWIGKCGFVEMKPSTSTPVSEGVSAVVEIHPESNFIEIKGEENDAMELDLEKEERFQSLGKEVLEELDPTRIDVWILNLEEIRRRNQIKRFMDGMECKFLEVKSSKGKGKGKERKLEDSEMMQVDSEETSDEVESRLLEEDLNPLIVCVGGYLLTKTILNSTEESSLYARSQIPTTSKPFTQISTLSPTLSSLSLFYSLNLPILLTGLPSSGKTSLLTHFHSLLHPTPTTSPGILFLPLSSSSLDATSLLGSFTSSPTHPGQFVWKEGSLTRAVRTGMWIVLEDIDKAGNETLNLLNGIVEQFKQRKGGEKEIWLELGGGRGKIRTGRGGRIWATRSSNLIKREKGKLEFENPSFLNHDCWSQVIIGQQSQEDVLEILKGSFPILSSLGNGSQQKKDGDQMEIENQGTSTSVSEEDESPLEIIVSTWENMKRVTSQPTTTTSSEKGKGKVNVNGGTKRFIGLRDLLKWGERVENLLGNGGFVENGVGNGLTLGGSKNKGKGKEVKGGLKSKTDASGIGSGSGKGFRKDPFGNQVIQEEVFLEACDVFLGNMSDT